MLLDVQFWLFLQGFGTFISVIFQRFVKNMSGKGNLKTMEKNGFSNYVAMIFDILLQTKKLGLILKSYIVIISFHYPTMPSTSSLKTNFQILDFDTYPQHTIIYSVSKKLYLSCQTGTVIYSPEGHQLNIRRMSDTFWWIS